MKTHSEICDFCLVSWKTGGRTQLHACTPIWHQLEQESCSNDIGAQGCFLSFSCFLIRFFGFKLFFVCRRMPPDFFKCRKGCFCLFILTTLRIPRNWVMRWTLTETGFLTEKAFPNHRSPIPFWARLTYILNGSQVPFSEAWGKPTLRELYGHNKNSCSMYKNIDVKQRTHEWHGLIYPYPQPTIFCWLWHKQSVGNILDVLAYFEEHHHLSVSFSWIFFSLAQ